MTSWFRAALAAAALACAAPASAQSDAAYAAVDPKTAATAAPGALAIAIAPYAAFQRDTVSLKGFAPKKGADVEGALDKMAGFPPEALARGWIAYGALAAARAPEYAEEIRKVEKAYGREKAVLWFSTLPHYAKTLAGYKEARQLALAAAAADSTRLTAVGGELRAVARGLDKTPWASAALTSKSSAARRTRLGNLAAKGAPILKPEVNARLTAIAAGAGPADAPYPGSAVFWDALETGAPTAELTMLTTAPAPDAAHASAVDAMVSVAALQILGAVDETPRPTLDGLMGHKFTTECFKRASLSFTQCVSAGRFHKENLACIAAEAVESRAQCVGSIAGGK